MDKFVFILTVHALIEKRDLNLTTEILKQKLRRSLINIQYLELKLERMGYQ